jgi:hypothetical protein
LIPPATFTLGGTALIPPATFTLGGTALIPPATFTLGRRGAAGAAWTLGALVIVATSGPAAAMPADATQRVMPITTIFRMWLSLWAVRLRKKT